MTVLLDQIKSKFVGYFRAKDKELITSVVVYNRTTEEVPFTLTLEIWWGKRRKKLVRVPYFLDYVIKPGESFTFMDCLELAKGESIRVHSSKNSALIVTVFGTRSS